MVDNPVFIEDEFMRGQNPPRNPRRERRTSVQGLSPYNFYMTSGSHASSGGSGSHSPPVSAHNMYRPAPNYYYPPPDYPVSNNNMWYLKRYQEDEIPNMSSTLYPQVQAMQQTSPSQMNSRRYSIASVSSANFGRQSLPQRRKISVSKYQNIPPANYLQVPSFHDYDLNKRHYHSHGTHSHQLMEPAATFDYMKYTNQNSPPSNVRAEFVPRSRRYSSGCIPSTAQIRMSKSMSRESSRSRSSEESPENPSNDRSHSTIIEGVPTPDPTSVPVPAFEFTSSHLPLRPPTDDNSKLSSGSGSASTPESQRIESRQMIRPSTSKSIYSVMDEKRKAKREVSKASKGDHSIFSITKPAKWCRHAEGKTCAKCDNNKKADAVSVCSSVNPPPTFTALDNYQPVRKKKNFDCTCSAIFNITVMVAVIIMIFISAFIIYVEMVLKHQTANVMDKM
ncbi:uncharacterized protein LOC108665441 isoform X2 [Hyalella azteca]|uniref:Uncharacterized protein LOC108665441 isoform X1 n=1 Tax=Hyalella azteca TaxID=294128 RepID=A0A8B7N1H3_HYAAZ|nr:uncharacterized protein LOC108665441 isoform X1 [Hyalella azteca]XP_018007682.1 uncharacterized protein LOC108665441 isoform X2 [Hyalella azteca]